MLVPEQELWLAGKLGWQKAWLLGDRGGEMPHNTPECALSLRNKLDSMCCFFFFSLENVIVIALYDFAASSDRDLELVKGEKLQVLSK